MMMSGILGSVRLSRVWAMILALLLVVGSGVQPALSPTWALVDTDAAGVNQAIRYGISQGKLGLFSLLGPNWIEGPDGSLLNIYTPFMMIASRVARGGYDNNDPSENLLKQIKKRYTKTIRMYQDPRHPAQVKFSVSVYGDSPYFARALNARIEGYGSGKKFLLVPTSSTRQKFAQPIDEASDAVKTSDTQEAVMYDAINSYYFDFKRLQYLDDYQLIISDNNKVTKVVFPIKNARIL